MNRLSQETSPYLLQHRDNPVDWFAWGEAAFEKAKQRDVPILLSVGYSTCHWCHVMAHESFENPETAAYMNAHFVNVKVDREERPDVDAVYMAAVQAVSGQGGWPMTVFLDHAGRPFYAGTYYPPQDAFGQPGFPRVLEGVARAWREDRAALLENAGALTEHMRAGAKLSTADLPPDFAGNALDTLWRLFDARHGGFGGAPKFPAPTLLEYLLTRPQGRQMALVTLEKMARGGLYDQLGGGFHRYSTDEKWRVPHFEKMLYDNAQLVPVYLHAWQLTRNPLFARVARETLAYLEREMLSGEGGFYSAQDADQGGIEGQFFVWTPGELEGVLAGDAPLAARLFGVDAAGNFQDPHHPEFGRRSVLALAENADGLAGELGMAPSDFEARADGWRLRLLEAREARLPPGTDDKVLTSWNGLALGAFAEAGRILGDGHYLDVARRNADFVRERLSALGGLLHGYKDGAAKVAGLLEDVSLYGLGLVALYRAGGNLAHLRWARGLWEGVRDQYWDEAAGSYWSTSAAAEPLIARQKQAFDSPILSDNAAAALLGLWMARYFGDEVGERRAARVVRAFASDMRAAPSGFGGLWQVQAFLESPHLELAVLGSEEERAPFAKVLAGHFLPFVAVAPSAGEGGLPLLEGRGGAGVAYLCRDFVCDLPARNPDTLERQLAALAGAAT